jgi:hypothetical protein
MIWSSSVRGSQSDPLILDLIEMDRGVVAVDVEAEIGGRQASDRGHDGIGGHDLVTLGDDQPHPRIQQGLLREQDIEGRALADLGLLADAFERDFRGLDRRPRRLDHRPRGLELSPRRDHRGPHLVAPQIGLKPGPAEGLLGLAHPRIGLAPVRIDRDADLPADRGIELTPARKSLLGEGLVDAGHDIDGRIELAFDQLDLELRRVDRMQGGLDARMLVEREADGLGQGARQQRLDGARRLQLGRLDADHLTIGRDARLQIRLRPKIVRAPRRELGLRLRDVGSPRRRRSDRGSAATAARAP